MLGGAGGVMWVGTGSGGKVLGPTGQCCYGLRWKDSVLLGWNKGKRGGLYWARPGWNSTGYEHEGFFENQTIPLAWGGREFLDGGCCSTSVYNTLWELCVGLSKRGPDVEKGGDY